MLDKSSILECKDIQSKEVSVPEWNGSVMVYGLTCGEKDDFESSLITEDKKVSLEFPTAKLCCLCIRDKDGNRIFSNTDIISLSKKSSKAMQRVYQVAEKLSGLGKGDVEEMVKNSEKIPTKGLS